METMKACEAVLCKACNEDEMRFKVGVRSARRQTADSVWFWGALCRTIEARHLHISSFDAALVAAVTL